MPSNKIKQLIFLQLLGLLTVSAISCNSKSDEDETEIVVTPSIVAVKNFYLQRNDSVMEKLDSVFFSIDLKTGVIFNADSLPKGTDVSRLIPSITFANTMSKAELTFVKDFKETITVDYLTNSTDSVDFSQPVKLDVTAQDGLASFSYTIKVNVHAQEPDSLMWTYLSKTDFPSMHDSPVAQKTIIRDNISYSLIEEYNGDYTLSVCDDLMKGEWMKTPLQLSFKPVIENFTATPEAFWILDSEGKLQTSTDGVTWNFTGQEDWVSILGGYANSILGVKSENETLKHAIYPLQSDFVERPVDEDFPVYNSSPLGVFESEWASKPMAMLACGTTDDGNILNKVWAFDGDKWGVICENTLPGLKSPMMVRYVVYRDTPQVFTQREFDVWMLFGGITEDGELNKSIFISYDNGVNWTFAPKQMQLPKEMAYLEAADAIVARYDLTADLSEAWTVTDNTKTRTSYTIDGFDITWKCPYLYVFGGYIDNGSLSTQICRGVLERLVFTPII